MKKFVISGAIGLALAGMSTAAVAQDNPPPTSLSNGADRGDSLSTKLNKSDGVIVPKANVDSGIHVTVPDPHPNSMPVVPPSATGGGTAK